MSSAIAARLLNSTETRGRSVSHSPNKGSVELPATETEKKRKDVSEEPVEEVKRVKVE